MFNRMIVAVITFAALLCCQVSPNVAAAAKDQWLIYRYVCGTDIESTRIAFAPETNLMSDDPNALILAEPDRCPGDATRCIMEVERASLSPNVKIFMQAGGTYVWGHPKFRNLNAKFDTQSIAVKTEADLIKSGMMFQQWFFLKANGKTVAKPAVNGKIGRYLYDKYHRNWIAREQLPISGIKGSATDMGSPAGFVDFLQAGQRLEKSLYPDGNVRRVLIFVNHGVTYSGGLYGICTDEYTNNSLSLKGIQNAFVTVQGGWTKPDEKTFEFVAFDACVNVDLRNGGCRRKFCRLHGRFARRNNRQSYVRLHRLAQHSVGESRHERRTTRQNHLRHLLGRLQIHRQGIPFQQQCRFDHVGCRPVKA